MGRTDSDSALRDSQAQSRRELETECRLFIKYDLRFRGGGSSTDRKMRDRFFVMVKNRVAELSRIAQELDLQQLQECEDTDV